MNADILMVHPHQPAVIDHRGQVYGCDRLFIVDASIFPTVPRAMPGLPVVLGAEQVATGI